MSSWLALTIYDGPVLPLPFLALQNTNSQQKRSPSYERYDDDGANVSEPRIGPAPEDLSESPETFPIRSCCKHLHCYYWVVTHYIYHSYIWPLCTGSYSKLPLLAAFAFQKASCRPSCSFPSIRTTVDAATGGVSIMAVRGKTGDVRSKDDASYGTSRGYTMLCGEAPWFFEIQPLAG